MCGIAGIAGEVEQMKLLLNKMIKAQQHRVLMSHHLGYHLLLMPK